MREATKAFLKSAEFKNSITNTLPKDKASVALAMVEYLTVEIDENGEQGDRVLNEYGVPILKGTSAFDIALFMLFVDVFDADSKTEVLADISGVNALSCKKWIKRLRSECMATVEWVRPETAVRGNIGKFVVKSWGIFDSAVYSVFKPYAKMVLNNYKSINDSGHSKS